MTTYLFSQHLNFRKPTGPFTHLLAVALFAGLASVGAAQTALEDPEAYREAKRLATETFLDSTRPLEARLDAVTKLGYPEDETFAEILRVGTDTDEPDEVRLAALKRYRYDDKYIEAVFEIIDNPRTGEGLAAGLIDDISRRTTFRQPAEIRQRLQAALRKRLTDPRGAVRLAAYRALVASHDAVAIDRLVESLRGRSRPPIPLPDAIELLDVDGPAKHIRTVQPYLENPDPAVRAQAARVLAVDPESRPTIVAMALDRETPTTVRLHALRALAREDENFFKYAIRLVQNRQDLPEIRYMAMKSAMSRLNYHEEAAATQIAFAKAVQKLASERGIQTFDGHDLAAEAKALFAHLNKYFPAIKNFFASR